MCMHTYTMKRPILMLLYNLIHSFCGHSRCRRRKWSSPHTWQKRWRPFQSMLTFRGWKNNSWLLILHQVDLSWCCFDCLLMLMVAVHVEICWAWCCLVLSAGQRKARRGAQGEVWETGTRKVAASLEPSVIEDDFHWLSLWMMID